MTVKSSSSNPSAAKALAIIALLAGVIGASAPVVRAEVYSWTDESGNMHFTDSAESIPQKYRNKIEVSDDESNRTWEYLASEYGADYYYDTANVSYTSRNRYRLMIKESYAGSGREEYETQVIMDCARMLYKPTHTVRIDRKQRSTVDTRYGREENAPADYLDGFKRFTHPYQVLYRMICKETRP